MPALALSAPATASFPDFTGLTVPFRSAEEAWFWTAAALTARREGARIVANAGAMPRPCEPDDVVRVLGELFRRGRIRAEHAEALQRWGERGYVPEARRPAERRAAELWREAMAWLDWPLRSKGIVA
jgi:hypothetical protein